MVYKRTCAKMWFVLYSKFYRKQKTDSCSTVVWFFPLPAAFMNESGDCHIMVTQTNWSVGVI